MLPRILLAASMAGLLALSGCVSGDETPVPAPDPVTSLLPPVDVAALLDDVMTFRHSIVDDAQGLASDLYEPTMEVSDTGVIYVAGHVVAAATTGTPAYYSRDDGATWTQLPFAASVSAPAPIQGAQPPPGDEGFIVYGDDGAAWMADIYAAGFSVTGWCGDGAELCYDNRQAYDRIKATSEICADGVDPQATTAASLNDRPWAAYHTGVGQLLLVNNPGGGPMQIGRMQVPPPQPVGSMDPVTGPEWNLCASPDGWIPGIPAMRHDGFFAVPQQRGSGDGSRMTVTLGNVADIFDVRNVDAFSFTSSAGGTSNGGRTAFDQEGTLFVGAYNNTAADNKGHRVGQFKLAVSTDDGNRFVNRTFVTGSPVRSLYLDSNPYGEGALLTWSQYGSTGFDGSTADRSDWYVAHVFVGPSGEPELRNVALAVDEGPHSSAHVMGASVGPDGRAYFVQFGAGTPGPIAANDYLLSAPISVVIQESGPTLPVGPAKGPAAST